jgi:hypothetical protein
MSLKRLQSVPDNSGKKSDQLDEIKFNTDNVDHPFIKRNVHQINFKYKLNGLDDKLREMKISNSQSEFLNQIQQILSLYEDNDLKYSHELVLFVMNEVERFILKSKSGDSKKKLTIECCKKYFDNNVEILEVIINLLFPKVKQVKFIKRQGLKILKFFLKVIRNQVQNK